MKPYATASAAVKPQRPILYVSRERFDAETQAAQLAEREPGFESIGTVAVRAMRSLSLALIAPDERVMARGEHRALRSVRQQKDRRRVQYQRRPLLAPVMVESHGIRDPRPGLTESSRHDASGSMISIPLERYDLGKSA